jgi:hypothetical protein
MHSFVTCKPYICAFEQSDYLVDKTGTTELSGEAVPKNLFKPFLVMIIPVPSWIIHAPNIKNSIETLQHLQTSKPTFFKK